MAFRGTDLVRSIIVIDSTALKQVSNFEYLGCSVSYNHNDVVNKLDKFNFMCVTIRRILKGRRCVGRRGSAGSTSSRLLDCLRKEQTILALLLEEYMYTCVHIFSSNT